MHFEIAKERAEMSHQVNRGKRGIFDKRNKLNDLTGKEWLKLSKSVWISTRSAVDKDAFEHPAPFLVEDIKKLILLFTKKNERVLDMFMGSGSAVIAATLTERFGIGIDLNKDYCNLAKRRLEKLKIVKDKYKIICGDSLKEIKKLEDIDYCVTSPPYHNILKNKGFGLRHDGSQRRQGVEYYSDDKEDVGNQETYLAYLNSLKQIMTQLHARLKPRKYCTVIISDFTVEKKETNAHGDVIALMKEIGFEFVGTVILVQDSKPLYPFGYPYAYKINHVHQYILNFRSEKK
jgi:DNA modification methylase